METLRRNIVIKAIEEAQSKIAKGFVDAELQMEDAAYATTEYNNAYDKKKELKKAYETLTRAKEILDKYMPTVAEEEENDEF